MAKIKYASFVAGLSGKSGSSVFFRSPSSGFGYMRALVQPAYTTTNQDRGEEMNNIAVQYHAMLAPAKANFVTYASKYKNLPPEGGDLSARANNAMACFVLMMWNIKKSEPISVDLKSLTIADVTGLFVNNIAEAVEAGYLPSVPGYADLNSNFTP